MGMNSSTSEALKALRSEEAALNPRLIVLSTKASKTEEERAELAQLQQRGDEIYEAVAALRRSKENLPMPAIGALPAAFSRHSPELRRILGGPVPYRTDHRLCRAPGTRDRVCAEYLGHDGPHNFVLQTQRED